MVMLPFGFGVLIARVAAVLQRGLKMEEVRNFFILIGVQDNGPSSVKASPKDTDAILIYQYAWYRWEDAPQGTPRAS
jgi:hypothetical protein